MGKKTGKKPIPIDRIKRRDCKKINLIMTDLDDTLTKKGKITARAYGLLWRLKKANIITAIVTGRPAGWAHCMIKLMPVKYVIFENGAGILIEQDRGRKDLYPRIKESFLVSEETRKRNFKKLISIQNEVRKKFKNILVATDQFARMTDIAFDICEERVGLSSEIQQKLISFLRKKHMNYKISSIHINAWFGNYTKRTACEKLIKIIEEKEKKTVHSLFIGDSPNDEPLFEIADVSIGVANIKRYLPSMKFIPDYVTRKNFSDGFAEAIELILQRRR